MKATSKSTPVLAYRVQEVVLSDGRLASTVLDGMYRPVEDVQRWLRHLCHAGKSPNTLRAYAYGARFLLEFCDLTGRRWEDLDLEGLGQFAHWLRYPTSLPAEGLVSIGPEPCQRGLSTADTYLAGVWSLFEFRHLNDGMPVNFPLWVSGATTKAPSKGELLNLGDRMRRPIDLPKEVRRPRTLTVANVQAIVDCQDRLRDRFLFALLATTGIRIGTALGLRHEDFQGWDRTLRVVRRDNANGARVKSSPSRVQREPTDKLLTSTVVRLHAAYMHEEYGDLDSDYVFANLWAGHIGAAMSYDTVTQLVRRTREKVGFWFTPHLFRHTFATLHLEAGVRPDIVAEMLDHGSVQTTTDTYGHISPQALRKEMEAAGVITRVLGQVGVV